ncbi:MAG: L,D-transpeptidase [Bdellovibrionota bacterium]|nr:MAG: L,D-transpeptidase [Bdellovibrionota bacterium]
MRSSLLLPTLFASAVLIAGCSSSVKAPTNWIADGSLSIHRPVPQLPVNSELNQDGATVFAFAPSASIPTSAWVSVDRQANELRLMQGQQAILTLRGDGLDRLPTGSFTVLHKQREPAWYAPDLYFASRSLDTPAEHSKERYLRGALGEYALFLAPELPLHCGPLWLDEIGGVRLSEQDMAQLYYRLEVGAAIQIE